MSNHSAIFINQIYQLVGSYTPFDAADIIPSHSTEPIGRPRDRAEAGRAGLSTGAGGFGDHLSLCRQQKEELLRRIISSTDRSVAVIGTSLVTCHLDSVTAKSPLSSLSSPVSSLSSAKHVPSSLSLPSSSPSPPTLLLSSSPTSSIPCLQDSSVELKCDITGRSTCVGDYNDFVHYFRDRYSKIREILSRRLNSRPIESLGKSTTGREVSLIGMVIDVGPPPKAIA